MGLFQAVKKLYHFEIPIGYCYSPLDGGIISTFFLHGSLHGAPSLADPPTKADHVIGVGTYEWDLAFNIF